MPVIYVYHQFHLVKTLINIGLVEDHRLLRKSIKSMLESNSCFHVSMEADNGKEFIELLSPATQPEIILLDIQMPVMNGFETAAYLKEHFPAIKVIALSLFKNETSLLNMLNLGAVAYITKNEEPEAFINTIMEVHNNGYSIKKDENMSNKVN
jgi:DNA-binding NarL/FixJ family response regulator